MFVTPESVQHYVQFVMLPYQKPSPNPSIYDGKLSLIVLIAVEVQFGQRTLVGMQCRSSKYAPSPRPLSSRFLTVFASTACQM